MQLIQFISCMYYQFHPDLLFPRSFCSIVWCFKTSFCMCTFSVPGRCRGQHAQSRHPTKLYTVCVSLLYPQDDAVVNMRSLAIQLKEMEEDRDRIEDRLVRFQKCLGEVEEGSFSLVPLFQYVFFLAIRLCLCLKNLGHF